MPRECRHSFTDYCDHQVSRMRCAAMLPQEHPLPYAEEKSTLREGHGFRSSGERHLDMTGHIVRTPLQCAQNGDRFRLQADSTIPQDLCEPKDPRSPW
jgi:hypothetical protein